MPNKTVLSLSPSPSVNVEILWRHAFNICISQHCMREWGLISPVEIEDFWRIATRLHICNDSDTGDDKCTVFYMPSLRWQ